MFCIYVNSKSQPYAANLVSGRKSYETRTRDVFKSIFASGSICEKVGIIETGNGFPVLLGTGYLFCGFKAHGPLFEAFRSETCIPEGDEYDIQPGGFKWMYHFIPEYKFKHPVRLDDSRLEYIPHNRSFCELIKKEA